MKRNNSRSFVGIRCRSMNPTQRHRPAIWENMLGTVFACDINGKVKYFDYDHEAARLWSGAQMPGVDSRVFRVTETNVRLLNKAKCTYQRPRLGHTVLWMKDKENK